MNSLRHVLLLALLHLVATSSTAQAEEFTVRAITATLGGPSSFVIASESTGVRERFVSNSTVIQNAFIPALLSGARLKELVIVPGSNVVARVYAYELGENKNSAFYGEYEVTRIATQRKPDATDEHLEVFLTKINEKQAKTYNIYDPFLQQLLIAAFTAKGYIGPPAFARVEVQFDGEQIVTVTLGEKYPSRSN